MIRWLPWLLGSRFIRPHAREGYLSFLSLMALLSMTLGVAALILILSVMNGFHQELRDRVLSVVPHGFITTSNPAALQKKLNNNASVRAFAPFSSSEAMIYSTGNPKGIKVTGIDPDQEALVSRIPDALMAGSMDSLANKQYRIIVGAILARQLRVTVGDPVTLIFPKATVTPLGVYPRQKRFVVGGIFQVGAQADALDAFVYLDDLARILREPIGKPQGFRIEVTDLFQSRSVLEKIKKQNPLVVTQDWSQSQGSLFEAIQMEKAMIGLLLLAVIFVAAFNIVSMLTMVVTEKEGAIAVLRTMGASQKTILLTFIIQGSLLGCVGVVLGLLIGLPAAFWIGDIVAFFEGVTGLHLFDPKVYFITELPSKVMLSDLLLVMLVAIFIAFIASVIPALRATKIHPSDVLRYE